MELNPGKIVYLNHFSGKRPIISNVVDTKEKSVKVKMTEKLLKARIKKNQPIVMSFEEERKVYTCETYVEEVEIESNIINLRIDSVYNYNNSREFERFPVSLYSLIKCKNNVPAIIKNISESGLCLTTKGYFKVGSKLEAILYVDDRIVNILIEIARRTIDGIKYEYGAKIGYPDYNEKNTLKLYLKILREEQKELLNFIRCLPSLRHPLPEAGVSDAMTLDNEF